MVKPTGKGGIDYPDFIQATTPHSNPVEITRAELAIRLGWPQVFERTGNVLYYESFGYGLSDWNVSSNIAANKPILASRGLLQSPYCARLTIDGTAAGYSDIAKHVGYPYITSFGFEFSFMPTKEFGELYFGILLYTGEKKYSIWARYSDATFIWSILDDTPAYIPVLTYDVGAWNTLVWHPVKMVVDLPNNRYARLMVDAQDVGLTQYVPKTDIDDTPPYLMMGIETFVVGTRKVNIYVDNVILTINEPI